MGIVYEAVQISLNRRVALKVLPFAAALDSRQLQRFKNEAQAAAGLHHTNIVPVYAVGSERGVHYYAMQFIEGQTLADVIREHADLVRPGRRVPNDCPPVLVSTSHANGHAMPAAGTPTRTAAGMPTERSARSRAYIRTAASLGVQAAEALEHAHQLGVVHRDIKPANLLVDGRGNLWVTDFGLAQLHGTSFGLTLTGDMVGTLRYMSPEQARAGRTEVDHRTDVYSLGVTLYELLTLRPAFPAIERTELLTQILNDEPTPPRRLNRSIPVELETIVLKALAKNPAERYATAGDLADDLRRFLDDKPIRARRPGVVQRLRKWTWRHRRLVASAAVSVALAVLGAVLGLLNYAIQQGRLASRESQFADVQKEQKRQTERRLSDALLDHAAAARLARQPGYRQAVWKDLENAASLDQPAKDPDQMRDLILACLGDPIGLEPLPPTTSVCPSPRTIPEEFEALIRHDGLSHCRVRTVTSQGDWLALAYGDEIMLIARDGKDRRKLQSRLGRVHDLAFAPDGRLLAAGCDEGALLWRVQPDVEPFAFFRGTTVHSLAIDPQSHLLATCGRQVELWSIRSGRPLAAFESPAPEAQVVFSTRGDQLLAVAAGRVLAAWPIRDTPEKRVLEGHQGGVPAVAFSPDGRRLASAAKDRVVTIWDATTGEPLHVCTGHVAAVEALAFSPDSRLLATGDIAGWVSFWEVQSGRLVNRVQVPGGLAQLEFDPAGRYLAACGQFGVAAWGLRSLGGRPLLTPLLSLVGSGIGDLALGPRGADLVYRRPTGELVRCGIEQAVGPCSLHVRASLQGRGLQFEPGGRLVFVRADGTIGTCDAQAGEAVHATAQKGLHLTVSPGGRWLATSSPTHAVIVYDLRDDRPVLTLPAESGEIWSLAWHPDGTRLAVGVSDGSLAVWDLERVAHRLAAFGVPIPWEPTRAGPPVAPADVPGLDQMLQAQTWKSDADAREASALLTLDILDNPAAARDNLLGALKAREALAHLTPPDDYHREHLLSTHGLLATAYLALDDLPAARRLHERQDPSSAASLSIAGVLLEREGRFAEALAVRERELALREEQAHRYPDTAAYQEPLAVAVFSRATALQRCGQSAEAERAYHRAADLLRPIAERATAPCTRTRFRIMLAACEHGFGTLLEEGQRWAEAEAHHRRALAMRKSLAGDYGLPRYESDLAESQGRLGALLDRRGERGEARRLSRDALQRQESAWRAAPTRELFRARYVELLLLSCRLRLSD
jgi:serine/threonine protein kinase/WD40 repeat protein/tetratricopeptide (TPR) repeat protein